MSGTAAISEASLANHSSDAIIVGAGPCGLFSAFQLGVYGLKAQFVDALDRPGGQCIELYPDKPIYDIPAFSSIKASELVDRLREQVACFDPVFHMGQTVVALKRMPAGGWQVKTSAGLTLSAPVVVIAAGGGSFSPKIPPNLKRLSEFEGVGVRYAVRRLQDHAGERVVIAGGGDSAVDWAIALANIAAEVVLVHQRDELRAQPYSASRLAALVEQGRIRRITGRVTDLGGEAPHLRSVIVRGRDGETELAADRLLVFFGFSMQAGTLTELGLELKEGMIAVDTERFETALPGIFAVGDIATYPGKLKLILSGFHEAALMAVAAAHHCRPGATIEMEYSTSSSRFQQLAGTP